MKQKTAMQELIDICNKDQMQWCFQVVELVEQLNGL